MLFNLSFMKCNFSKASVEYSCIYLFFKKHEHLIKDSINCNVNESTLQILEITKSEKFWCLGISHIIFVNDVYSGTENEYGIETEILTLNLKSKYKI